MYFTPEKNRITRKFHTFLFPSGSKTTNRRQLHPQDCTTGGVAGRQTFCVRSRSGGNWKDTGDQDPEQDLPEPKEKTTAA